MRKKAENKEIKIENTWFPSEEFDSAILACLYQDIPSCINIIYGYDPLELEKKIKSLIITMKGCAEIAWVQLDKRYNPHFALDLAANELFDPKEEGIITFQEDSHQAIKNAIYHVRKVLLSITSAE